MRYKGIVGSAIVFILLFTTALYAETAAQENPSFVLTETKTTKETVEAVDYATRKVTLKDEAGNVRIVRAGTDIHNLGRLKIGDEVTIETFKNISVEVKPGPGDTLNVGYEGQTAPLPGEKPSGIRTVEGTLKTKIESIDHDKRTVTFKGRDGGMKTYRIGPEAKRFNEIRRGDMIWAEYSQTIKLSVK